MSKVPQTPTDICCVFDELKQMLLDKNRKYGDSALDPVRIFSKGSPLEQLKVRMDDKLSRVRNAQDDEDEDPVTDLIGYLVLYKVALMQQRRAEGVAPF
jgi:hypothetical protein